MLPALIAKNSRGRPNVRHGIARSPIGLAENRHAKAFALQQPTQQCHREARMIDVRIAGDEHHVDRIPPAFVHLARVIGNGGATRLGPVPRSGDPPRAEAMLGPSTMGSDKSGGPEGESTDIRITQAKNLLAGSMSTSKPPGPGAPPLDSSTLYHTGNRYRRI